MEIKHQLQPTEDSCMATCLAMILHKDAESIDEEFSDLYHADKLSGYDYLMRNGIIVRRCYTDQQLADWDELYIITVPSLNIPTGTHAVIIDYRKLNGLYSEKVYDPNKGKEGKKYYDIIVNQDGERIYKPGDIIKDTDNLGYTLNGFSFEYEIFYPDNWGIK